MRNKSIITEEKLRNLQHQYQGNRETMKHCPGTRTSKNSSPYFQKMKPSSAWDLLCNKKSRTGSLWFQKFLHSNKPFTTAMKLWGLYIETPSLMGKVWIGIMATFMHLRMLAVLGNSVYYILSYDSEVSGYNYLVQSFFSAVTLASFYNFEYRKPEMLLILNEVTPRSRKLPKKFSIFWTVLILVYGISQFLIKLWLLCISDPQIHFNYYIFSINVSHLNLLLARFLAVIDAFSWIWFAVLPQGALFIYFMCICYALSKEVRSYVKSLEQILCNHRLVVGNVIYLSPNFCKLCKLINRIDDLNSPLLFWWFFCVLTQIAFCAHDVISSITVASGSYFYLYSLIFLAFNFVLFFGVSLSAAELVVQAQEAIPVIFNALMTPGLVNRRAHRELSAFYLKVLYDPPQVTGWKVFVINRGFACTSISVLITYSVILFQF